jgi:hypothetical protein
MNQLLIIKDNISEIKKFCEQRRISYEIYNPVSNSQAEKIKMFADYDEALQDKELEAEKTE